MARPRRRYRAELEQRSELLAFLRQKSREGTVTLIYAARDEQHNSALALKPSWKAKVGKGAGAPTPYKPSAQITFLSP